MVIRSEIYFNARVSNLQDWQNELWHFLYFFIFSLCFFFIYIYKFQCTCSKLKIIYIKHGRHVLAIILFILYCKRRRKKYNSYGTIFILFRADVKPSACLYYMCVCVCVCVCVCLCLGTKNYYVFCGYC